MGASIILILDKEMETEKGKYFAQAHIASIDGTEIAI